MRLILLTYINRSGSTFLANLFSKSSDILVCPEGEILMNELLVKPEKPFILNEEKRRKFIRYFKEDPKLKCWNLTEEVLDHLPPGASNFEVFVLVLGSYRDNNKPGAEILLFKAERLIYLFDQLMGISSVVEITFLSVIRDCRGVYASQKRTRFPDQNRIMSKNPVRTALDWSEHVYRALQMGNEGNMELLLFEEIILNTRKVFSQLLKKIGIPFFEVNGLKGDLFSRLPESHRMIHNNIIRNPIISKCNSWRKHLSNEEILLIQRIAGKQLSMFGYELDTFKSVFLLSYFMKIYFYTLHIFANIFNKIIFRISELVKA